MKKILFILPILISCNSTKEVCYNNYGLMYVEQDTVVITTEHIHYNGRCYEPTTTITCVVDTFRIPKHK